MDFGNVRSLTIGGKAVSRLLVGGRLVWKKAEPGPAYDYEVEYLEADGTQYVSNAFEMDFDTISVSKVYVRARFFQVEDPPSNTASGIFYGSVGRLSFGVFKPNGTSSGTSAIKYGNNATVILGDSVSAHDIEVGFEGESYYSVFDGVRTDHADWSTSYGTTIATMGILCRGSTSGGPSAVYPSRIRVYSLSCNVADLIPVVKDGRPCFYNKLNGEFLYSSSGVDFIAGPKVVPKTPYIETDGNSYMDLGFVPSTALDYEISLRIAEPAGAVAYLFGTVSNTISAARYTMAETKTQITLLTPSITWGDYDRSIENAMQRHTYALQGDYYLIDGVEYPAKNVGSAPTGSMHIGHCVVGKKGSIACFYYAKFWESGVLIRDLVPYSGSRGVGLLDKVHDVLYTNAGGGTLTYGQEVGYKYAFVQTKGLADSFWAAPISQLGCQVAPSNPEHFAFVVDMEFQDGFFTEDYGIFGFTKCNLLFNQNMASLTKDTTVYAYAPGSVINVNGTRHIVTPGERHVIKFEFDPLVGNYVDVDGEVSLIDNISLKLPHDTSFKFGGNSGSTVVTSVTKPVKMRVYGVKILQFHNLVADLVPYNDGSDVGMMDKLSGNKFPGSNLEYGEV